jgi:hypothetical protein
VKSIGARIAVRQSATLLESIVVCSGLTIARWCSGDAQRHLRQQRWLEDPTRGQERHESAFEEKAVRQQLARELRPMQLGQLLEECERRYSDPRIQIECSHARDARYTVELEDGKVKSYERSFRSVVRQVDSLATVPDLRG